jgi:hypothetical protein
MSDKEWIWHLHLFPDAMLDMPITDQMFENGVCHQSMAFGHMWWSMHL